MPLDAREFAHRLDHDPAIREAAATRIAEARAAMAMLPGGGVPQLLAIKGETRGVIQGPALYSGAGAALEAVRNI